MATSIAPATRAHSHKRPVAAALAACGAGRMRDRVLQACTWDSIASAKLVDLQGAGEPLDIGPHPFDNGALIELIALANQRGAAVSSRDMRVADKCVQVMGGHLCISGSSPASRAIQRDAPRVVAMPQATLSGSMAMPLPIHVNGRRRNASRGQSLYSRTN